MVEHTYAATQAVVTLDVPIPQVIWGWMITLNMWAKSIGTGVVLIGAYLLARHNKSTNDSVRKNMPIISFVFLNIFLLFTLLDLHQPLRMINIFLHPNWSSAITVGAWMATVFTGIMFILSLISVKKYILKKECNLTEYYDTFLKIAVILSIPVTLYTATIMGEATARELWQTPTELAQMMLAALLCGSGIFLLIGRGYEYEAKRDLAIILGLSAFFSLLIYMGEYYFGHMKAEEASATIAFIREGGIYNNLFWTGQVLAFILPMFLVYISLKSKSSSLLTLASISAIVGLFIAKHVWLIIPQLLPLS